MIWTAAPDRLGEFPQPSCGQCGRPIGAEEPMALVTSAQLKRCVDCAGAPVDWAQVESARAEMERARFERVTQESLPLPSAYPVTRQPRPTKLTRVSDIAADTLARGFSGLPEGDR